jgi:glycosyltransferase involved in cell wall biosynthesis
METLAAEAWTALEHGSPGARLVAHGGTNRLLPWFFVTAWARTAALVLRRRVDVVVCYDAATYLALWPLLAMIRVPRVALVNGLDLTWERPPYGTLLRRALPRASRVLAISRATAQVARGVGVPDNRLVVVPPSVDAPEVSDGERAEARRAVRDRIGTAADDVVLLTVGRLVARKGARWFVEEVLPGLPHTVHYVIAGSGPEHAAIARGAVDRGLEHRVHLLGAVTDAERETLLRGADVFVQPNVATAGDMEGFGLVLVEAAKRGTPVVASALEGMPDAVADGESGVLCPPGDGAAWREALTGLVADPVARAELARRFADCARARFDTAGFGRRLEAEIATATASGARR